MTSLRIAGQERGSGDYLHHGGIIAEVTAEAAGWTYLNMQVRRLNAGEGFGRPAADTECVHVALGGMFRVDTEAHGQFPQVGGRTDVFSGKPHALYLSRGTSYELTALSDGCEVATCTVPAERDFAPALITPEACAVELRGAGNASRQITSIIPPGFPCHRLVCVEVYTPGGNWSSYPPHKHDVHTEDADGRLLEADLEEIYFYKIDPPGGFAYQRVYTADGRIDEVVRAGQNDSVLVPEGYHPVVSAHGYTTYYLNFLAGSAQSLANTDDPAHAWVKESWPALGIDPRLPIVR